MRSLLRSLFLVTAMALGGGTFAQLQYWAMVYGQVTGCTPGQVITVTSSFQTVTATVDPNCYYWASVYTGQNPDVITTSTPCQGAIQTVTSNVFFNGVLDSALVNINFNCGGGGTPDCLGIPGGTNVPGTPCTNPATGVTGTWSANCVCVPDTTGGAYDCLGVLNGSNLPGTPCWTPGTNFIGVWDANCNCSSGGGGLPCQAGFWVIQAYGQDSLPVPNEVWVWNLSTGNGALTYLWNFGDGTTSTDPFPTHTYSQNGPYLLCLTIADASGCTSTSCDTVSIDENGLLNGMMIGGHVEADPARTDGFTLNIQNPLTTSMAELQDLSHAAIWPNPSNGDLNLALVSTADGPLSIRFFDVNGREVRQESRAMNAGRSQHRFDIADLPAGIYTLRATDRNGSSISIRFVKAE